MLEPKFPLLAKVTGQINGITVIGDVIQIHEVGQDIAHLTEIGYSVDVTNPPVDFEVLMLESELELV